LHIKKCAGIDFELSYKTALEIHCRRENKLFFGARADDENTLKKMVGTMKDHQSKGVDFEKIYGIFTSHMGIKRLNQETVIPKTNLMTILRPPVDRLISLFNYNCMRSNTPPQKNDFNDFISQPEQINQISHLLSEKDNLSVDAIENNIRETFFGCYDISRSSFILGELLSRNQLPNIIKERLNQTLPEFKLKKEDLEKTVLTQMRELNAKDIDLYERFKALPVEPRMTTDGRVNLETLLMPDIQTQKASKTRPLLVKTDPILAFLHQNRDQLPDTLNQVITKISGNAGG
tara:strand:+ start:522 stop:1391 length:870 start_codon:yes stop_codon:yes gene_type:complete